VQIIDFGRDADTGLLFIAMELLSGRDLACVIADERPMPIARAVKIISQVLAALEEAHAGGVIHRDLKPANVMLVPRRGGEGDVVKVCDFGIAKAGTVDGLQESSQLTMRGLVWGTPEYMSPEQARGEDVDARADIYAAGIVLYHMLAGEIPFSASSP